MTWLNECSSILSTMSIAAPAAAALAASANTIAINYINMHGMAWRSFPIESRAIFTLLSLLVVLCI